VLWLVFASVLLAIAVVLGLINPQQGKKAQTKNKTPKSKQKETDQNSLQNSQSLQPHQMPVLSEQPDHDSKSPLLPSRQLKGSGAQTILKRQPNVQRNKMLDKRKNIDKSEQQKRDDSDPTVKSESENELQLLNWTKDALEVYNHEELPLDSMSVSEKRIPEDEWRSKKSVEELLKKRTLELEKDLVKTQRQAEKYSNKVKELKILNAKLTKQKNQIEHEFVQKIVKLEKQLGRYDAVGSSDKIDILKGMNYVHRNSSRTQNTINENPQATNGDIGYHEEISVTAASEAKQPRKLNRQFFKRRQRGPSGRTEDIANLSNLSSATSVSTTDTTKVNTLSNE